MGAEAVALLAGKAPSEQKLGAAVAVGLTVCGSLVLVGRSLEAQLLGTSLEAGCPVKVSDAPLQSWV